MASLVVGICNAFYLLAISFVYLIKEEWIGRSWIVPADGDIVNMEIPESKVFDKIDLLELRYFNNNEREVPRVCHQAMTINRGICIEGLASHMKIHGYISGTMEERAKYVETIMGFPIVKITDKGTAIISTMSHEKGVTDPIAGRLLTNMIRELIR